MASRIIRPTLVGVAAVTGSMAYSSSRPLFADDGLPKSSVVRPGRSSSGEKLPIYPRENDEIVTLIENPNPITPYVTQARLSLAEVFSGASGYVQDGVSRWITFERKVEKEVKTVLPSDESLTPGLIYVLVAGLTGSVITRTRSFPLRFLTPPLFTLVAMPYFLPKTSHNLRTYISDVEDRHFPEFAASHDQFNARLDMHWDMLRDRLGGVGDDAKGWGQKAMKGIEDSTGLKVGEAMKRGREKVQHQRENLDGITAAQAGQSIPVETVGYVVEAKPIAEIVKPAEPSTPATGGKRMV